MWVIGEITENDTGLLMTAFEWYKNMPGFLTAFRDLRGTYDTFDEFRESCLKGMAFYGHDGKKFCVMVYIEMYEDGAAAEGHLLCRPDADLDLIAATARYAKTRVLEHRPVVMCHVLRKHRALLKIMEQAGLWDSGMRAWQGVYRGRPQEVLYYVADRRS